MTPELLAKLEEALEAGGQTHSLADVAEMIQSGDAQLWIDEEAVIVTEIIPQPMRRTLHFWLAAGTLDKVIALSNELLEWGKQMGCDHATLSGRRGWVRALASEGWEEELVLMGKDIG